MRNVVGIGACKCKETDREELIATQLLKIISRQHYLDHCSLQKQLFICYWIFITNYNVRIFCNVRFLWGHGLLGHQILNFMGRELCVKMDSLWWISWNNRSKLYRAGGACMSEEDLNQANKLQCMKWPYIMTVSI